MDDNSRNRFRYTIYVLAGLYLLHTAYGLFKGLPNGVGNEKIIIIISMIVFVAAAVIMIVVGVKKGFLEGRQEKEDEDLDEKDGEF
ncbi:MAG: hypothetical protein HFG97_15210 [Dorea sp.]|nr:hypothetical protein [Dorea sp.]